MVGPDGSLGEKCRRRGPRYSKSHDGRTSHRKRKRRATSLLALQPTLAAAISFQLPRVKQDGARLRKSSDDFGSQWITGYGSAIATLAMSAVEMGIQPLSLKAAIVSGDTLLPAMRSILKGFSNVNALIAMVNAREFAYHGVRRGANACRSYGWCVGNFARGWITLCAGGSGEMVATGSSTTYAAHPLSCWRSCGMVGRGKLPVWQSGNRPYEFGRTCR